MAHYERLERIDYKSARDVVTEVDHLSEALIIDAIRARYPDDAILAEESGEHRGGRGRGSHLGQGPGLDRRPARRHRQLRQRHPVLLRVDRARRRRPTGGRASSTTRSGARPSRRRAGGAATLNGRADPRLGQGAPQRLRGLDGALRPGGRDAQPDRAQGRPHPALDGLGGARARLRRRTAASTPSSSRAGSRLWDIAAAGLIAERGGAHGDLDRRRAVVRRRRTRRPRSASSPRRRPTTRTLLDLVRLAPPHPSSSRQRCGSRSKPVEAPFVAERVPLVTRRAVPAQLVDGPLADRDAVLRGPQPRERRGTGAPRPSGRAARRRGHRARRATLGTSHSDACSGISSR